MVLHTPAILFGSCQQITLFVEIFRIWQNMLSILNYFCTITIRTVVLISPVRKEESPMSKDELIQKINEMLNACNDIPLIHLIYKLLIKSL